MEKGKQKPKLRKISSLDWCLRILVLTGLANYVFSVALSLREQVLEAGEIPMGEFDRPVDGIVTPDGIIGDDNESLSSTTSIADVVTLAVFDTVAGSAAE